MSRKVWITLGVVAVIAGVAIWYYNGKRMEESAAVNTVGKEELVG